MESKIRRSDVLVSIRDILSEIFRWMDPTDRAIARFVCARWRAVVESSPARTFFCHSVIVANPKMLTWMLKTLRPPVHFQQALCYAAISRGLRKSFGLLLRFAVAFNAQDCAVATTSRGELRVLKILEYECMWRRAKPKPTGPWCASQLPWAGICCIVAARKGHIEVLRHFIDESGAWPVWRAPGLKHVASVEAGKYGRAEVVVWLNHPNRPKLEECD